MAKLKLREVKRYICTTCHGNGYIRVQQVIPHEILETTAKYINVGTVNQKENFMKQWILMMFLMTLTVMIVLTNGI